LKSRAALLIAALGFVVLATDGARAHFPMVFASAPWVEKGGTVVLELTNGHPFWNDRYPSPPPERVAVRLPLGSIVDLTSKVVTHVGPATPAGAGTAAPLHRVEMPLRKEGDYIFSWRTRTVEKPQRNVVDYVKVVIHCGEAQMGWWGQLKEPLEIMPLSRPYALRVGDTFRGQVLEETRPMLGGVVEAETWTDAVPQPMPELAQYRRAERTDPNGCFSLTFDRAGWWLVSCATDGGPGEQGGSEIPQKRAVLWVFVGLDPNVAPGSAVRPVPSASDPNQPLPQVGMAAPSSSVGPIPCAMPAFVPVPVAAPADAGRRLMGLGVFLLAVSALLGVVGARRR
jgi:cobalt/nickel transport protein